MTPGEAVARSPLEKPLNQLTEDDISQLTREDCRRFLKEKGMRRPSWNKSQAIQQVISLKALFETTPDSEAPPDSSDGKKLVIPHRVALPSSAAAAAASVPDSNSTRMSSPDSPKREFSGDPPDGHIGTDSSSPRITTDTNGPIGQMTIFYSGKVNVYDDVPREKAWTIMQLAANPFHLPQEGKLEENAALLSCSFHPTGCVKVASNSPVMVFPALQTVNVADSSQMNKEENYTFREDNLEGPSNRKASVQRYLEKRKDRFKRKVAMSSSTGLDIYLNHRIGDRISNEHSGHGDVHYPSQAGLQKMPIQSSPDVEDR